MPKPFRYIALIPAAGVGTRLGQDVPKQYLRLGGRTMLEHSIAAVLADARIDRVFVVVAPTDELWQSIQTDAERVEFLPVGGASRAASVRNGLIAIASRTREDDRVLVHDAARPCLGEAELARLIDEVGDDDRGGLLAVPLTDTLKRGEDGHVVATLQREGLWCAQTPQMFRFASLRAALGAESLDSITDEASAIERNGNFPMLVLGSPTNIKVTTAQDLTLASAILGDRESVQ
ncbi:MAG TPA: 2-C-methyl-D-erythritol 4-phosphate cytidylyltransferase [Burkholderiaceae bacterium]|nr:2-C-methyl-D-erythritol 4-phosphate cytidylyltransferase [Burkholderiaceae bacterium]